MMVFGLLTIRNTRRPRITPTVVSRYNRTEEQLGRMLFVQVSVHIFLTLPFSIIYLISSLPNPIGTTSTYSFASTICQLVFNFSYGSSFFLYILSGSIYKQELKKLIFNKFRIPCVNQVQPSVVNENINLPMIVSVHPRSTT